MKYHKQKQIPRYLFYLIKFIREAYMDDKIE